MDKLLFEKSVAGSNAFTLGRSDVPGRSCVQELDASLLRQTPLDMPELPEVEAVRHFTALSHRAYGVDDGMYPLGSCTMKYNPKINEWACRLPGFANIHPEQPAQTVQGALALMAEMESMLCEIGGMDAFTLQPAAGAQGEMTGMRIIKAYHDHRGDAKRTKVLIPDSAHGTNPATAHVVGYDVVEVKSDAEGMVDLQDLAAKMNDEIAGLMLTNPNTLGLFERNIAEIARIVHKDGGLLYYDGANLNAIMGVARPGDMGFDVVHYNLHKTFSTPHGGGGPGSGPVGVKAFLEPFLPKPVLAKTDDGYAWDWDRPLSIGKMHAFYGNFSVVVRAYTYLKALGADGVRQACQLAVLNANYLRVQLADTYEIAYDRICKHEFVCAPTRDMEENGVGATDICKRLLDEGYHPPTVHFPLIVHEALMIEPTETESKARLDAFVQAMKAIAQESVHSPEQVKTAPHHTVITRVDEVRAARSPIVTAQ